jgi:putative transposase
LQRITVKRGRRLRRYFSQPGGSFDHNVTDPLVILRMIEYIHANPVRRGLVQYVEDWKWSTPVGMKAKIRSGRIRSISVV